jgi:hypothetical protein
MALNPVLFFGETGIMLGSASDEQRAPSYEGDLYLSRLMFNELGLKIS